jgi:hypothetical protein
VATFSDLLYGLYEVEVTKGLTTAEMARATSAVHLFAGGRRLHLPVTHVEEITVAPDQRGSLVFSELMWNTPHDLYCAVYGTCALDSRYFEIFNNSDTTVYLDGKYWGIGWDLNRDFPYWPCEQTAPVRDDPDGIWTRWVFRFPGRGTDYALAPGGTALVAQAAIDHRAVEPELLDLRGADFEWGGYSSADNPDVPNLDEIGPSHMPRYVPGPSDMPEYLSEPVDLDRLPRYVDPYSGRVFVRIPRALVLDAWAGTVDYASWGGSSTEPACLEDVNRAFERLPGPAAAALDWVNGVDLSFQRRALVVLPNGRKMLQDSNTSMFDFVKAPRTPGWIPDSLPGQP